MTQASSSSARNRRHEAHRFRWTERDRYCLWYIGHMHALSFEQLQRLLARESPAEEVGKKLSQPRTFELVSRWLQTDLAIYRRVYHEQSGSVHLTAEGLGLVHLPFRAKAPEHGFLSHVYAVNEVHLHLEEQEPALRWISERLIQTEQRRSQAGGRIGHIPDGVVLWPAADGTWTPITSRGCRSPSLQGAQGAG